MGDWLTKATLKLFGVTMSRTWRKGEDNEPARGSLKNQIAELVKSEDLSEDRQNEIIKAVEVDNIAVRQIMIPPNKIKFLSTDNNFEENLTSFKKR